MANYLVTGGAGFIGSHIAEYLVNQGQKVRILDNFVTGKKENIQDFKSKIDLLEGDIRDLGTCHRACDQMEYVFHQAALGSVPRSVEDPITTNEVNVTGTLNMLIAARDAQVERFVFASSSSVYGDTPDLPKVETMPPRCLSPYALSKYAGETYTRLFYNLYGLKTIVLRYFNVFGPRQDPHSQYAAVIPKFITTLLKKEPPVIYGDGEQGRDFTFVRDVVEANVRASQAPVEACGVTYNIACHRKTTVNELYRLIRQVVSEYLSEISSIEPIHAPPRAGDIRDSLADISRAWSKLGFMPQLDFKTGLSQTVQSFIPSFVGNG